MKLQLILLDDLFYRGTAPDSSTATVMTGTGTEIGTVSASYLIKNPAETAGYMYTSGEQHGTSDSSPIKTKIDNWYETTTLNTDSATKSLIADQIFCNDRSITDGTWPVSGEIYFSAYTRLGTNKSPILTCPTVSDKFTVSESNGNGVLDYPAGLITADEIAMAGGMWYTDNTLYYLNTDRFYLPGTPFYHPNDTFKIYDTSATP